MAEKDAKAAAERLRTAHYQKDPTVALNPLRAVRAIPPPAGINLDEVAADPAEEAKEEAGLLKAAAEDPVKEIAPWGFVVSITRNGRHRKLHRIGDCRLIAGIHYGDFEVWGDKLPGEQ